MCFIRVVRVAEYVLPHYNRSHTNTTEANDAPICASKRTQPLSARVSSRADPPCRVPASTETSPIPAMAPLPRRPAQRCKGRMHQATQHSSLVCGSGLQHHLLGRLNLRAGGRALAGGLAPREKASPPAAGGAAGAAPKAADGAAGAAPKATGPPNWKFVVAPAPPNWKVGAGAAEDGGGAAAPKPKTAALPVERGAAPPCSDSGVFPNVRLPAVSSAPAGLPNANVLPALKPGADAVPNEGVAALPNAGAVPPPLPKPKEGAAVVGAGAAVAPSAAGACEQAKRKHARQTKL